MTVVSDIGGVVSKFIGIVSINKLADRFGSLLGAVKE
jgi:hypothetical protein